MTYQYIFLLLLRHDLIMLTEKVQEIIKFYEVFEATKKDNFEKHDFCFSFIT